VTLRWKLALALAPLALAMLITSIAGGAFLTRLGQSSERVLQENYRSVLALQRMMESLQQLDSSALLHASGRPELEAATAAGHRRRFEHELRVQQGNITEAGEEQATRRLASAWSEYLQRFDRLHAQTPSPALQTQYFDRLRPAYVEVRSAAEAGLLMNQDAMVRKSEEARRIADRSVTLLVVVSIAGFLLALYASAAITSRLLRPLSVLGQATRRIGEGDLAARVRIEGTDEIAKLAADFNAMADRLQKYRESSLGELLEAQRASQATIDSLPDPVLVLALEGYVLQANRAAEATLKIDAESGLAGLDPTLRDVVERVRQHVASGKGPYVPRGLDEALRVATAAGERRFLPRATPVLAEEGAVVGTTLVLQDVTRLLRFEELRNNLVATVAHEFRTPLTSLRMAIHLLTEQRVGPLTEKQADLVFAAREDCDRLQSTVDELLDLSRIQAGRIELRTRPAEVESLVNDAIDAQRAAASARHVELRSEVLPGMGQVLADVDRIQLVFANLLSNAIRHSPEGGTVSVRALAQDGAMRFEVNDAGRGIPREYQQAIFQKYFQMPESPPGGAGLGLFIAKEVLLAHGGQIGVESEPGKGATFWFELNRVAAPGSA
jgi:signal transduction histidine kinase